MAMVLPHVDVMLHDFKLTDRAKHLALTGADNRLILENYQRAYRAFPQIRFIARVPLLGGVNDDEAHIRAVLDFIRAHPNVTKLELLPCHDLGAGKYRLLGRSAALKGARTPTACTLERVRRLSARNAERARRGFPHEPQGRGRWKARGEQPWGRSERCGKAFAFYKPRCSVSAAFPIRDARSIG